MDPHILSSIITLLLIACVVAIVAEWFNDLHHRAGHAPAYPFLKHN